jgi:hypothetical protein
MGAWIALGAGIEACIPACRTRPGCIGPLERRCKSCLSAHAAMSERGWPHPVHSICSHTPCHRRLREGERSLGGEAGEGRLVALLRELVARRCLMIHFMASIFQLGPVTGERVGWGCIWGWWW